jgi:molecular chaperone HscB
MMSDDSRSDSAAAGTGAEDYFEVVDLPRRVMLDDRELQNRYFALGRLHHPDFHAQDDAAARQRSLEQSSLLNRAYRTLRDPFERARHLVSLEWPDMPDQERKSIPSHLLMEVMEMQETVSELHAASDPARREALATSLGQIEARLQTSMSSLRSELDRLGAAWDALAADDGAGRQDLLKKLNALLNTRNYLRTLLATIDAELHGGEGVRH